jgi:hypothetical protein
MPRWVIDHDPDSGRVEVTGVGVELHVVIERTGRVFEDRHEVRVRQVAGPGRDFVDGCAADALGEVLGLGVDSACGSCAGAAGFPVGLAAAGENIPAIRQR